MAAAACGLLSWSFSGVLKAGASVCTSGRAAGEASGLTFSSVWADAVPFSVGCDDACSGEVDGLADATPSACSKC